MTVPEPDIFMPLSVRRAAFDAMRSATPPVGVDPLWGQMDAAMQAIRPWLQSIADPARMASRSAENDAEVAAAVATFDAIAEWAAADPEAAHANADDILLEVAAPEVRAAYERVAEACPWWACA